MFHLRDEGIVLENQRGCFDGVVGRSGPDLHAFLFVVGDVVEFRKVLDVHQDLGRHEILFKNVEQGLPARDDLGVILVLGKDLNGLFHRFRCDIVEVSHVLTMPPGLFFKFLF